MAQIQRLGLDRVYHELELPLQPVLRRMEQRGIPVHDLTLRSLVCNHFPLASIAARLRRAVCPGTGRLHTQLDSLGTCTGRITASNYPVQSLHRELRPCVTAGPNRKFVKADYGQFEWRIAAWLSGDPLLLDVFSREEFDLYAAVASAVCGPERAIENRGMVKDHMMQFLYSPDGLNPVSPTAQAVSRFLATNHSHLICWLQTHVQTAASLGAIRTPYGRHPQWRTIVAGMGTPRSRPDLLAGGALRAIQCAVQAGELFPVPGLLDLEQLDHMAPADSAALRPRSAQPF